MKIYILICETDTSDGWGSTVHTFLNKQAAQETMRKDWQETVKAWEYDTKAHDDESESSCTEDTAVIRDNGDIVNWRIEENELPVQVAVRVDGGLVTDVYANTDLKAEVYDLDVSAFPDAGEQEEADAKEADLEKLTQSPGWRAVW